MPRRKQDCPKRMKLEEERRGKAAKSSPEDDKDAEDDDADEGDDDDEEGSAETEKAMSDVAEDSNPSREPEEKSAAEPASRVAKRDQAPAGSENKPRKRPKKRARNRGGKSFAKSVEPVKMDCGNAMSVDAGNDPPEPRIGETDGVGPQPVRAEDREDVVVAQAAPSAGAATVSPPSSPIKPDPLAGVKPASSPHAGIPLETSPGTNRSAGDSETEVEPATETLQGTSPETPEKVSDEDDSSIRPQSSSPAGGKDKIAESSVQGNTASSVKEEENEYSPLDFSVKKETSEEPSAAALNLSEPRVETDGVKLDTPLDLSVPRLKSASDATKARKRPAESNSSRSFEPEKSSEKKSRSFVGKDALPWAIPPDLQAAMSMGLPLGLQVPVMSRNVHSPSSASGMWNGKVNARKSGDKSDATADAMSALDSMKALERMQDLTRISGSPQVSQLFGQLGAWHSPWFTQNRSAASAAVVAAAAAAVSASQDPTTRDILRCVWCHQSFPTFNDLSVHMRDAKHCGPGAPPPPAPTPTARQTPVSAVSPGVAPGMSSPCRTTPASSSPSSGPPSVTASPRGMPAKSVPTTSSSSGLSLKETMPLPRKLVRGQDVWLGKGAEQTRQILKCMWCGQSFKSLADMTTHMQQTQHYTNIISQEQIISWKSPEDKASNQSHVSAVLTCKVCNQGFSSLKDLSSHMVKNSHYKEHMMRSISESGSRRRQAREKRKKSLPVRKLLEIERAQSEIRPQLQPPRDSSPASADFASRGSSPQAMASGAVGLKFPQARIPCDKCGLKVFAASLFDHYKKCHGTLPSLGEGKDKDKHPNLLMSALLSVAAGSTDDHDKKSIASDPGVSSDSSDVDGTGGPRIPTPLKSSEASPSPKENASDVKSQKNPSVLNALEKLIEKSFDSNVQRHAGNSALGSSILRRLGIDETVDCTKPLIDSATLAAFTQEHHAGLGLNQLAILKAMEARTSGSGRRNNPFSPRSLGDDDVSDGHESASDFGTDRDAASSAKEDDDEDEEEKKVRKSVLETPVCVKKEIPPLRRVGSPIDVKSENAQAWKGGSRHESKLWLKTSLKHEASLGISSGSGNPAKTPRHDEYAVGKREDLSAASPASTSSSVHVKSEPGHGCLCDKPNGKCQCVRSASASPGSPLTARGSGAVDDDDDDAAAIKPSAHPLAALQKLCDKTETTMNRGGGGGGAGPGLHANGAGAIPGAGLSAAFPGAILAFSWACNDAIVNSDSIMKCAFCDTPFISKGAYRHHLSKMHFVKDGLIPDPFSAKPTAKPPSPGSSSAQSGSGSTAKFSAVGVASPVSSSSSSTSPHPQPSASAEESPHAKFLKYTEMAKQLSSKYV